MDRKTNIIKLQYLKDGKPAGISYSYYSPEPVAVGDLVDVENKGATVHCIVTQINVPEEEIAKFKDRAKTIIGLTPAKEQPEKDYVAVKTVKIPAFEAHEGYYAIDVKLVWNCPVCGKPRGDVYDTFSYDGSRRLPCHGWINECGHVDSYRNVRHEAATNKLN